MKFILTTIRIVLFISVFANIVGCSKEMTIADNKYSTDKEINSTNPNTVNKTESDKSEKTINTYHDEKFGFSVDFPKGWGYRINKYIEPSKEHNGTPDAGVVIFIDNNPQESIYVFGQVSNISMGDQRKETFTTSSGLPGDLYVNEKDGIKDLKIIFGRQCIGAFVLASPESYYKNELQIMEILKSIRVETTDAVKEPDKENINALVEKAITVQYENKTDELDKVFTREFISKIDSSFYKSTLKPYSILNIGNSVVDAKDTYGGFYLKARIKDIKGEYIQEIHFVKVSGKYLISKIENDI